MLPNDLSQFQFCTWSKIFIIREEENISVVQAVQSIRKGENITVVQGCVLTLRRLTEEERDALAQGNSAEAIAKNEKVMSSKIKCLDLFIVWNVNTTTVMIYFSNWSASASLSCSSLQVIKLSSDVYQISSKVCRNFGHLVFCKCSSGIKGQKPSQADFPDMLRL